MRTTNAGGGFEAIISTDFANAAPSFLGSAPIPQDDTEWLSLMRHFGAPTRLLDWSRNVLVAVYFAVESSDDEDGELIAIDDDMLTRYVREKHCTKKDPLLPSVINAFNVLAQQARTDRRFWMGKKCSHDTCCPFPIPFGPPLGFPRITNQLSWFTIHPHPEHPRAEAMEQLLSPDGLRRWRIGHTLKPELREHLAALGITKRLLFPDLGGLAETIVSEFERKWCRTYSIEEVSEP